MAEVQWFGDDDSACWDELAALSTRAVREVLPSERPVTAAELRGGLLGRPTVAVGRALAVTNGNPVGAMVVGVDTIRPASAWLNTFYVVPAARRQGIGSRLLAAAQDYARDHGRNRLRTSTVEGDCAATAFVRRAGGQPGLVNAQSRCPTATLDRAQLRGWVERAAERATGYSLVSFDGVCPDDHLDAFVAVIPVMNTAPHDAATEDVVPTHDEVRQMMAATAEQGAAWTVCARDDRTGEFVGYTELFLPDLRPWQAAQGDTGVHPDHRERGLGRWLKATTALRLLDERPQVEFIQTWNAAINEAMLSINVAMGFEVVARRQQWHLPVDPA